MPELRLSAEQVDRLQFSHLSELNPEIYKLCVDWMNMYHLLEEISRTLSFDSLGIVEPITS